MILQFVCIGLIAAGGLLLPGSVPGVDRGAVRLAGDVVLVAGLLVIGWAVGALRRARSFTAFPRPLAEGALVESGPYGFVRHPVYSGLILTGLGATVSQESVATGLATVALAVVLDLKRRREELWLVERFPGYAAYRTRTRALIPVPLLRGPH